MYVSALAASLRSITGIHIHNLTALRHRLVGQELLKLKEVPHIHLLTHWLAQGVLPLGSLLSGHFPRTATNASEFFQHDGRAFFQSLNYLLRNTMVDVFSHQSFAPTQLFQVYLCGMGLLTLQLSSQPLISVAQLFNSSTTEEPVVADDSQLLHASVNTDHLPARFYIIALLLTNDVQVGLVLNLEQVCRTSFPRKVLLEMLGDEDGQPHPPIQSQNVDAIVGKVHRQRAVIVANSTTTALGTRNLLSFLLTSKDTSEGFGRLGSGGNSKLAFQSRIGTDLSVGQMMQANTVELLVVPSGSANEVESIGVCVKRWLKHLLINLQLHFNGPYLFHIPPVYMSGKTDFLRQNHNYCPLWRHSSHDPKGLALVHSVAGQASSDVKVSCRRRMKSCVGMLP